MSDLIKSIVTTKEIEWDGKPIGKPGIYVNVPMSAYHSNLCIGPSVSSSGLRKLESKSPAHYFVNSYLNPDRIEEGDNEAFRFGRAAHWLLLGEVEFNRNFVIRPDVWDSYRSKDAKAWRDDAIAEGLTPLIPKELDAIKGIAMSLDRHPHAKHLLRGKIERSIVFQDKTTGIWLKSRPDAIPSDEMIGDLKTTTDASTAAALRSIEQHDYAMQGALVAWAMKEVAGIDISTFALVFVEKTPPYAVNVIDVDREWLWYARQQLRHAINTFAECVRTGDWHSYVGEPVAYIPDRLRKRLDMEMDTGLLPREDAA